MTIRVRQDQLRKNDDAAGRTCVPLLAISNFEAPLVRILLEDRTSCRQLSRITFTGLMP